MDSKKKLVLAIMIAMIMVLSSLIAVMPQSNNASVQGNSAKNVTMAGSFSKLTSTQLQPIAENFSGISKELSHYHLQNMNPNKQMTFMVNFQIPDSSALTQYITEEATLGSPYYHKYLTYSAFQPGGQFGISKTLYQNTIAYYAHYGFVPIKQTALGIEFQGVVSQVNTAFNTNMVTFMYKNQSMYTNNKALNLPSFLASSVLSIDGLTNLLQYQPTLTLSPPVSSSVGSMSGTSIPTSSSPALTNYLSHSQVLNYSKHSFLWTSMGSQKLQFMFPTTMPALYNATGLINKGYNGKGINIAIVMEAGYNPSDLYTYAKQVWNNPMQILNRIKDITVNGATPASNSTPLSYTNGGAGEFSLDIEYSSTMAPGAHIYAAYGPDLSTLSLDLVYAALASNSTHFNIITNSWGGDEDIWWNLFGPSWQNALTMTQNFQVLTSMGSSILASSGDNAGIDSYTGFVAPSFPADSPYVTSVGGVRSVAANGTNGPFPTSTNQSNFTLAPYTSGFASTGLFFPDMTMNVSSATGLQTESYWYTVGSGNPKTTAPYAGGQFGLSYWNAQPYWQHGPAIPNSGRLSAVDIAAEADFNESEYFAGGWVFFWGGTSFACPTTAGLLADILSYTNATTSINEFPGGANPSIFEIGNFAQNLSNHDPFYTVTNGSNPYAQNNLNLGWPGNMYYPNEFNTSIAFNGSTTPLKYNYLTGWGSINGYNFAQDLKEIFTYTSGLSNSTHPFTTLYSGKEYNYSTAATTVKFILYNNFGRITDVFTVTALSGKVTLNTNGMNNGTIEAIVGGEYFYAYVHHVIPGIGHLNITLLTPKTITGGFSTFNQFLSDVNPAYEFYPLVGPLMPNTAEVQVTLNGTPVANAQVLAQQSAYAPFDNPYAPFGLTTNNRSIGFTNMTGIAFVETWNVANNVTYYINATYQNQTAGTQMYVMPQLNVNASSSKFSVAPGSGVLIAPAVVGNTNYTMEFRAVNVTGKPVSGAYVSIDCELPYGNFGFIPVTSVEKTSKNGYVNLSITSNIAPAEYFVGIMNSSFSSMSYNGQSLISNTSEIPIIFQASITTGMAEVVGATSQGVPYGGLVADQNSQISAAVVLQGIISKTDSINGTINTGVSYWFNNMAPSIAPIGYNVTATDPQNIVTLSASMPSGLTVGMNTFNMKYSDTMGVTFYSTTQFYYMGAHTTAAVNLSVSSGTTVPVNGSIYYSGQVTLGFSNNLPSGFGVATLNIANSSLGISENVNVTDLSSYTVNFANLPAAQYTVTYSVTNGYGQTNSTTVMVNTGYYTVTFTETGLSSGTTWGVHIGGKNYTTTNTSLTVNLPLGTYAYSVIGVSGYTSPSSSSVTGSGSVQLAYTSIPAPANTVLIIVYIIAGVVGGFVVGAAAITYLKPKKP